MRTQLREGAKADLYASADEPNMQGAQQDGTIASEPRIFVQNRLVAITPAQNRADLGKLQDLAKPGLKLVLAQKDVPVGNYSRQALTKMAADPAFGSDFATKVLANQVSDEANVRQVVAKVQLGEADAGIVYASDVTPAVRSALKVIDIPDQFNVVAKYPIAVVKGAPNEAVRGVFIDYVLSPPGQAVMVKNGFITVGQIAGVATDQVMLRGLVENGGALTVAALQQFPAETVQVTFQSGAGQQQHSYKGVRLFAVLDRAKVKENSKYKNDKARKYVQVVAKDGYETLIAWGEIDPEYANQPILLAWEEDGKPLVGADGPVRLVMPMDKRGSRYVGGVVSLEVRDADSPPR